jgi:hypothetical protein
VVLRPSVAAGLASYQVEGHHGHDLVGFDAVQTDLEAHVGPVSPAQEALNPGPDHRVSDRVNGIRGVQVTAPEAAVLIGPN